MSVRDLEVVHMTLVLQSLLVEMAAAGSSCGIDRSPLWARRASREYH